MNASLDSKPPPRPARLWWWVALAFAIQAAAWTGWMILASQHRVQEVPLAATPR